MDDEQKKLLAKWIGGPMMLGIGVVAMMWNLIGRRPRPTTTYPTGRGSPFVWGTCCTAECEERVRPAEFLCLKHWIRVPVAYRMRVLTLQTKTFPQSRAWVVAACTAVIFVRDEIAYDEEVRLDLLERRAA